jgi:hypothetical protein
MEVTDGDWTDVIDEPDFETTKPPPKKSLADCWRRTALLSPEGYDKDPSFSS